MRRHCWMACVMLPFEDVKALVGRLGTMENSLVVCMSASEGALHMLRG